MPSQYAVIGLGVFGQTLVSTLSKLGADVLAIDIDPHKVDEVKDYAVNAISFDVTDEKALKESGVADVDVAVVAIGENIEVSVLVTALLKKMGIPRIISKATSSLHADILKHIGANEVIDPEREMGIKLAKEIIEPSLRARIPLSTGHEIIEVEAPSIFFNKTLEELQFRQNYDLSVIAIKKRVAEVDSEGEVFYKFVPNKTPKSKDKIEEGDILVLIGEGEKIKNFLDKF